MTVHVDNMKAGFGRMKICHIMADTTEELLAKADKNVVARNWIQDAETVHEHFDIAQSKRALAVQFGAVEFRMRDIGVPIRKKRGDGFD
ncbi:MAG: DUF4031 domain-containing protein, partial [Pseudomonadota bacterium]